jgi:acid phosphatase (class A)
VNPRRGHLRHTARLLLIAFAFAQPAWADSARYISPAQLDLTRLLAPPPAADSEAQRPDLQAVLDAQKARTPQSIKQVLADVEVSVFRFADVLGPSFTAVRLPRTQELFNRVRKEASAIVQLAKRHWKRPRPYQVAPEVRPVAESTRNASYPSGHSMFGNLAAILLANMVPEKSAELFERGRRYGDNRVVGGLHYPSDNEAGRISAVAIAAVLFQDAEFRQDFAAAKTEVRAALGLSEG